MRPGSGGAPIGSSSLPVAITCRRGRRCTATSPTPAEASADMRGSVRRSTGRGEHVAGAEVLAAVAHVAAGRHGDGGSHAAAVELGVLGAQDRVGVGRERRAGGDAGGRAGLERVGGDLAGGDLAHEPQRHAGRRVRGAHRVAVHRRAVERRQVDRARRVLGDDRPPASSRRTRSASSGRAAPR